MNGLVSTIDIRGQIILGVAPGIVVDFDENNNIVGIDMDQARKILSLSELEITSMPTKKLTLSTTG